MSLFFQKLEVVVGDAAFKQQVPQSFYNLLKASDPEDFTKADEIGRSAIMRMVEQVLANQLLNQYYVTAIITLGRYAKNVHLVDNNGNNVWHYYMKYYELVRVSEYSMYDLAQYFFDANVDVNAVNKSGLTPLMFLADSEDFGERTDKKLLHYLLNRKATLYPAHITEKVAVIWNKWLEKKELK